MSFPRPIAAALVAVAAATVTACSGPENASPVATVSVAAPSTRVAIGSPLDLTYTFQATAPIDGDYKVFVHLLNADGERLWADDHDPPVPTSQWTVGTPVTYSRTRFLPSGVLHPGDVTVVAGLYRDGDRLPLQGPEASDSANTRAYPVAHLTLAPESENVFVIYQSGWYSDEYVSDDASDSWKWTQKVATFTFRHPRADTVLLLEMAGQPDAVGGTPQQVTVIGAGNEPLATLTAGADPTLHRVPLTTAQMGTADLVELRLEVDRTFVPSSLPGGSGDDRTLGVRVYHLYLERR